MPTVVQAAGAESGRYYAWEAPEGFVLRLSHRAVRRILAEAVRGLGLLPRRGAEVGGILVGAAEPGEKRAIRVEDAVPVPCQYAFGPSYILSESDRRAFAAALRKHHAVGYYRTHTRPQFGMSDEDVRLLSEHFPGSSSVALLVKPRAMQASVAGFFFRDRGQIRGSPHLELPAEPPPERGPQRGRDRPSEPERPAVEATTPLPSFLMPQPAEPAAPFWASWPVQLPLIACLLLADGFLGFIAARHISERPAAAQVRRDPYALSLIVLEYGENLHLNWDRYAPVLASASRGVLTISDGGQARTLELDRAELENGSVSYRRMSKDVQFRLEVLLEGGRSVSETWKAGVDRGQEGPPSGPSPVF